MFNFRIATAAIALLAPAAALAGGYTAPVVPVTPVVAPDVQTAAPWGGFYAGLSLGYGLGGDDEVGVRNPETGALTSPDTLDISGGSYGIHAGYRFQTEFRDRQIVIGPELSYEAGNISDSFNTGGVAASNEVDKFYALRVKTGIVSSTGQNLFYGIAGVGRGEFNYAVEGAGMSYEDSYKDNAWILGLGAERKINERMSVFGEWEFRGYGKTELTDANGFITEATPEHHHIKLGVNFNF